MSFPYYSMNERETISQLTGYDLMKAGMSIVTVVFIMYSVSGKSLTDNQVF